MRYRPLGNSGAIVSAVSLRLRSGAASGADAVVALVHGALEQGVNYFEVPSVDADLMEAMGEAIAPVDRSLLVIALRLDGGSTPPLARDFSAETLAAQIVDAQRRMRLNQLDIVMLDDPASEELTPRALETLKSARSSGRARLLAVGGVDDAMDAYITTGAFDLLALPFNLTSGWRERRRVLEALRRDMAIVGYDSWPEPFQKSAAPEPPLSRLAAALAPKRKAEPLAGAGGYAFLDNTPGWSSEQICLAYTLNDVNIATVMVEPTSLDHLQSLTEVTDREVPAGVSAQVEMARFSAESA